MAYLTDAVQTHPLLTLISALATWYLISTVLAWHRLRHIPGPVLASLSNLWLIRASTGRRFNVEFMALGRQYGALVRVAPNMVLATDGELLRLTGAVRGAWDRGDFYVAFRWQPYVDTMFSLRDRGAHDRRKARAGSAYNISGREVDLVEPSVDEQVRCMVRLLQDKYVHGDGRARAVFDFALLSSYLTMDVATRAVFGDEFGYLRTDSDVDGFLAELRAAWPMVALVSEWPLLRGLFYSKAYLKLLGPKATDKKGVGKLMSGVARLVQKRFADKAGTRPKKDMLSSWMHHGLDRDECEAEGLLAIVAGTETTASVMRITLLSILSSPAVYSKLKATIRDAVSKGNVAEPISYTMAKEIPYLRAVIYEGLRMRPSAIGSMPKVVPPEGITWRDGTFIPGGTLLGANLAAMLRDTDVFGADADLFRPERFLEASDAARADMERETEMVFGTGRWMCAGKPIAFMELFKTFFELLRHFDIHIVNPVKPLDSVCYSVFVEENMWLRITKSVE